MTNQKPRCPKCNSENLSVERRLDGDAKCLSCGWSGPYKSCFKVEMTDEEFDTGLKMLEYFWEKNSDVTRWSEFEKFKPELEKRRPDIATIIDNYLKAERALSAAMKNL